MTLQQLRYITTVADTGTITEAAKKKIITNEELADYPYLSYEQGEHNSFYFSEEIFSSFERKKNIRISDRAPYLIF